MTQYHVNAELFKYLTRSSGHTLPEVADLLGISLPSLYHRLNERIPFRIHEVLAWADFVSCAEPTQIFYLEKEA